MIQWNESSKHKSWLQNKNKFAQKIKKRDQHVTISWKHCLFELFDTIVLDEVHVLRNLNNQQIIIIYWFKINFHILLTSTLFFNSIKNFKSLILLILKLKNDNLWIIMKINSELNSFNLLKNDFCIVLCLT